jgi:hypothetical protein
MMMMLVPLIALYYAGVLVAYFVGPDPDEPDDDDLDEDSDEGEGGSSLTKAS